MLKFIAATARRGIAICLITSLAVPSICRALDTFGSEETTLITENEAWCGAKCLWIISNAFDVPASLNDIAESLDVDAKETGVLSLAELENAARQLGFQTASVATRLEELEQRPEIAIVVIEKATSQKDADSSPIRHAQVLLESTNDRVLVIEPLLPSKPITLSRKHFLEIWTGQAVLISKQPIRVSSREALSPKLTLIILVVLAIALLVLPRKGHKWRSSSMGAAMLCSVGSLSFVTGCDTLSESPANEITFLGGSEKTVAINDDNNQTTCTFEFRNDSNSAISITNVAASCDCTKLRYTEQAVAPGEKGLVSLDVDLSNRPPELGRFFRAESLVHFTGERDFRIPVVLVVDTSRRKDIPVASPQQLSLGKCILHEPSTSKIALTVRKRSEVKVLTPSSVEVRQIHTPEDSQQTFFERRIYSATFTPTKLEKPTSERIEFLINSGSKQSKLVVPVVARVEHPLLLAQPSRVSFGKLDDVNATVSVWIRCRIPNVSDTKLPEIEIKHGPQLQISKVLQSDGERCELSISVEKQGASSGFVEGSLEVHCKSRDMPPLVIPYFGYW